MPPHGENSPCPLAIELASAKIASDNATAMMSNDVFQAFKRMGLLPKHDEDE